GIVTYGKDPEVQGELSERKYAHQIHSICHPIIRLVPLDPEVQGESWDGRCYVFDERISVAINQKEHVAVGKDYFDGQPCERYVNCADPDCNKQIICSEENEHKYLRGCTHACRVSPRNMYVEEHNLSEEEIAERLHAIGEEMQHA